MGGQRGIPSHIITEQGRSRLAHLFGALACADWTAYYLALLNGIDPTAEDAIMYMKSELA